MQHFCRGHGSTEASSESNKLHLEKILVQIASKIENRRWGFYSCNVYLLFIQIGLKTIHIHICIKQYFSGTSIKISIVSKKSRKKIADQPIKSVLSSRYWRFNEEMRTMDPGYPKPITIWRGVPDSPQGAFVDKANGTSCPVPPHSDLAEPAARGLVCHPAVIDPATGQPERSRID